MGDGRTLDTILALSTATVIAFTATQSCDKQPQAPVPTVTPMQTAQQDAPRQRGTALPVALCRFEDGNVDGRPCLWRDPSTGATRVEDSSEYRR